VWCAGTKERGGRIVKTATALVLVAVVLAGCVSSEQTTQMQQEDDAVCRYVPGREYNACMRNRAAYTQTAAQQRMRAIGNSLQQAGAALQSAAPATNAGCTCQCVNGRMQPLCSSSIDLPPICPPAICPITAPSIAPIQPPTLPPLGTSSCRQAQVCDTYGNCRWQQVCR
jgi:hypothetical protein